MAYQFSRNYELLLDDISVKNLHFDFTVNRNIGGTSNSCSLSIHNLSKSNFKKLAKDKTLVSIFFSYSSEALSLLYKGHIIKAVYDDNGTETITTKLECVDGAKQLRSASVNRIYDKGTKYKKIIEDVTSDAGYDGVYHSETLNKEIAERVVLVGDVSNKFEELSKDIGADWSIQNNKVVVLPRDHTLRGGVNLDIHSGLVGAVKDEVDGNISFKTLLDPAIEPGGKVVFNEEVYKVEALVNTGSNYNVDNYTNVTKAVPVNNGKSIIRNDKQHYTKAAG